MKMAHIISTSAELSIDELYRYSLTRTVDRPGKTALWIGVNPSTADAEQDDQSIRKLYGFGDKLGIRKWLVGNLFAYRATDVTDLRWKTVFPVGIHNDEHLRRMIDEADWIIAGWGRIDKVPEPLRYRVDEVVAMVHNIGKQLWCWGTCQDGSPRHPLMVSYATRLEVWR